MNLEETEKEITEKFGLQNCTTDINQAIILIESIETTILKGCCGNRFALKRFYSSLNMQTDEHNWQARFFGIRWQIAKTPELAICKAAIKLYKEHSSPIGFVLPDKAMGIIKTVVEGVFPDDFS